MASIDLMAECQYHYYSTRSSASSATEKEALNTKTMANTELVANKTRYSKTFIAINNTPFNQTIGILT